MVFKPWKAEHSLSLFDTTTPVLERASLGLQAFTEAAGFYFGASYETKRRLLRSRLQRTA